tara:strand:+ start:426 stop:662 length:237 start_codon:yes stop_codon:yes gene_type:complete
MQANNQRLTRENIVSTLQEVPSPRFFQIIYWDDGTAQITVQHTAHFVQDTRIWFTDSMSHEEIELKRIELLRIFKEEQ